MHKYLKAVMRGIARGEMSRGEAARRLGVSQRHVNRLMRSRGVVRPRADRAQERELARARAEERRSMKADAAASAAAGRQSIAEAATWAGCSLRTMYRWVADAKKSLENAPKSRKKRSKSMKKS